jgi:methionine-rich copper-binding protein CopC
MITEKIYRFLAVLSVFCAASLWFSGDSQAFTLAIINNNPVIDQSERLVSSTPYEKQVLTTPPEAVSLTFSQPVRPDRSSIRVLDMYGSQVDSGELDTGGLTLSVAVPNLGPGKYTVKWRARCRCDDDNELSDSFHFTVQ